MSEELLKPGWRSRTVKAGELSLHLVETGPEEGPPVLLLHGFPEFWWAWRHQLDALAQAGFRAIAPDLRGYNLSEAPTGVSAYRTELLAGDVVNLADALGLSRFRLVGHDWGGLVAWAIASGYAERVERLVIMDAPHPEVWAAFAMRHPSQAVRSAYVGWFQAPLLPEAAFSAFNFRLLRATLKNSAMPGTFDEAVLDRYAQAWNRPGRLTAMLNYYRALPRSSRPRSGKLPQPVSILWGERDSFLDNRLAQASAEQCSDARVTILPGATHWLHHERPELVNAELLAFL